MWLDFDLSPTLFGLKFNKPGRNEGRYSKERLLSLSLTIRLIIKAMNTKEMGISPGVSCWEKEKAPARGGSLSLWKRLHSSNTCQTTLQVEIEKPRQGWLVEEEDTTTPCPRLLKCACTRPSLWTLISFQDPKKQTWGFPDCFICLLNVATLNNFPFSAFHY